MKLYQCTTSLWFHQHISRVLVAHEFVFVIGYVFVYFWLKISCQWIWITMSLFVVNLLTTFCLKRRDVLSFLALFCNGFMFLTNNTGNLVLLILRQAVPKVTTKSIDNNVNAMPLAIFIIFRRHVLNGFNYKCCHNT